MIVLPNFERISPPQLQYSPGIPTNWVLPLRWNLFWVSSPRGSGRITSTQRLYLEYVLTSCWILFLNYIMITLLWLPQFFPLCPSSTRHPPFSQAIPTPLFTFIKFSMNTNTVGAGQLYGMISSPFYKRKIWGEVTCPVSCQSWECIYVPHSQVSASSITITIVFWAKCCEPNWTRFNLCSLHSETRKTRLEKRILSYPWEVREIKCQLNGRYKGKQDGPL